MTTEDLMDVLSKADPNATSVDVQLVGAQYAKRNAIKVAAGLKAKVLRASKDLAGNPVTIVRLRVDQIRAHLHMAKQHGAPRPTPHLEAHLKAVAYEARQIRKHLAREKAKGTPFVAVLWHKTTVVAPALAEVLETHDLTVVLTELVKPNDLKFLTEPEFTRLRAKTLEETGVPLETQPRRSETPA